MRMASRLKNLYENSVIPNLQKQFQYTNQYQVPKISKIVINRGVGNVANNELATYQQELGLIASQTPIVTKSKKAIAGLKLRKNQSVGLCVTLRGEKMYAFLDRLIHLALPRIRDFQGMNVHSFDGRGNFHFGLPDQLMFPEIEYDSVGSIHGMDIHIVTTADTNQEALVLLQSLGMPWN
jgi:large subunit ribosomal protein L5